MSASLVAVLSNAVPADFFQVNASAILALTSAVVTTYFWFVKANQERAGLRIYQTGKFHSSHRSLPSEEQEKHPGKAQASWSGELVVANISTLPSAVIGVEVELKRDGQWLAGHFGWGEGGELPWNIKSQTVCERHVAAFFHIPDSVKPEEVREEHELRFTLLTLDGRRYRKIVRSNFEYTGSPL